MVNGEVSGNERRFNAFRVFLTDFVEDLNQLAAEGWVLLVEGKRDKSALRSLGYRGKVLLVASLSRPGLSSLKGSRRVVILTDLDREGGHLAARFQRRFTHDGVESSLSQRKRLLLASRGVFRHIENLSRFADPFDL